MYFLVGADLLMVLAVIFKFTRLPPQIPLFYSRPWGEDQLGDVWLIILLPIFMHLFFFLNNFFYRKFFSADEFVKKIIYYLNLFLVVGFTFIFLRIIFLIS